MNKRGQDVFPWINDLLLYGVIVISFFSFSNLASDTTLERGFLSRDLALLLDTVYASPGDVAYLYDIGNHKFVFEFSSGVVSVRELKNPRNVASYRYSEPRVLNAQGKTVAGEALKFREPKSLEIRKAGGVVQILPLYADAEVNAKDELARFSAFLLSLGEQRELCKSEFSFGRNRLSGYYIVYREGSLLLYQDKGSAAVDSKIAPLIAYALDIPPEKAFDSFESSIKEVAFGKGEGYSNFILGDAVVLQKGRKLAFGQDLYSQVPLCAQGAPGETGKEALV